MADEFILITFVNVMHVGTELHSRILFCWNIQI